MQEVREAVSTIVWDGVENPDFLHEEPFFSSLNFAVPITKGHIHAALLDSLLTWLLRPDDTVLVEGPVTNTNGQINHRVLMILVEPTALYNPQGGAADSPVVGIGVVFKPPYVKHVCFSQAHFHLSQWHLGVQSGISEAMVMFVLLDKSSDLGPYVEPYPLWVDTVSFVQPGTVAAPVSQFRFFKLHRVGIIPPDRPDQGSVTYVCMPRGRGFDSHFEPSIPDLPLSDVEVRAVWTLNFPLVTADHWSLKEDEEAFQQHLAKVEVMRVEAAEEAERAAQQKASQQKASGSKKKTVSKQASKKQTPVHQPVVKVSRAAARQAKSSILQQMMDAENIEEGDMDADLLLSRLLDEEADVDTLEIVDEFLKRI